LIPSPCVDVIFHGGKCFAGRHFDATLDRIGAPGNVCACQATAFRRTTQQEVIMVMFRGSSGGWSVPALILGCVAALMFSASPTHAKSQKTLSDFMRKKLDASSQVLEGLTTEDKELVTAGASALLEMSTSEVWQVLTDEDYREFNRDFRASVRKLKTAAEQDNFDNATLQWFDTVKSCVECHKYVRGKKPVLKN
jgi:hypothetical protein